MANEQGVVTFSSDSSIGSVQQSSMENMMLASSGSRDTPLAIALNADDLSSGGAVVSPVDGSVSSRRSADLPGDEADGAVTVTDLYTAFQTSFDGYKSRRLLSVCIHSLSLR
jgi:hypothetical protein